MQTGIESILRFNPVVIKIRSFQQEPEWKSEMRPERKKDVADMMATYPPIRTPLFVSFKTTKRVGICFNPRRRAKSETALFSHEDPFQEADANQISIHFSEHQFHFHYSMRKDTFYLYIIIFYRYFILELIFLVFLLNTPVFFSIFLFRFTTFFLFFLFIQDFAVFYSLRFIQVLSESIVMLANFIAILPSH